jgi:hypothetical protein
MDKNNGICRADGFFSKSETEVYLEVRIKNITALILCTSYRSRFGLDEATSTIAYFIASFEWGIFQVFRVFTPLKNLQFTSPVINDN